jgi:hypothetical protein
MREFRRVQALLDLVRRIGRRETAIDLVNAPLKDFEALQRLSLSAGREQHDQR